MIVPPWPTGRGAPIPTKNIGRPSPTNSMRRFPNRCAKTGPRAARSLEKMVEEEQHLKLSRKLKTSLKASAIAHEINEPLCRNISKTPEMPGQREAHHWR